MLRRLLNLRPLRLQLQEDVLYHVTGLLHSLSVYYFRLVLLETVFISFVVKELVALILRSPRIHHRLVDAVGRILQAIFNLSSEMTPGGSAQDHC